MYRLPSGKWRVERDFDSKPAALAAFDRVTDVTEAGFLPPKPIIASVPRVPHDVASAAMRDGVAQGWVGGTGQVYESKMEAVANGEQLVSPYTPPRDPLQDDDEGAAA